MDPGEPYEKLVYFNLVLVNLNDEYDPYDPGEGQLPSQAEWNEIFAMCAKQHLQYWDEPSIQKPPLAVDGTGVFKLSPAEETMALSVGPDNIVEEWKEAINTHMLEMAGQAAVDATKPSFDVAAHWKGENAAQLYRKAMARLAKSPMTLIHGDVNPGNIWKSSTGKTGDERYCFADWQMLRMGPCAWEFTTPQIGIYPGVSSLIDSMKEYHRNLCKLKPELEADYPFDTFKMHVQCASVAFWQWIWAFVYASTILPTNNGELEEGKKTYTWSKFFPECFAMMGASMQELELEQFCIDLLKAEE